MKNYIKHSLIATAALLSVMSCDLYDDIYNTSHPNQATVTLGTDWSNLGAGLPIPNSYTVVAGDFCATLSAPINKLAHFFNPSEININVYNTAEHISMNGTTATVATATGNADDAGPFIQSSPGWLFASFGQIRIEKDKEHNYVAVMQQQVRQLTLVIEPTGDITDKIERIEGHLTGAAASLNYGNGMHTKPSNVAMQFARIADGPDAGKWAATVRLLGTADGQQRLRAQIHFAGGSPAAVSLDSDLSTELATFNADKRTPLTLGGQVVETPTEAGFGATITGWAPVTGSGTAD